MKRWLTAWLLLLGAAAGVAQVRLAVMVEAPPPPAGEAFPQAAQILAHWNFSDGSGSTLSDVSGNGFHVPLANANWSICDGTENCLSFNETDTSGTLPQALLDALEGEDSWTLIVWAEHSAYEDVDDVAFAVGLGSTDHRFMLPFDTLSGNGLRVTGTTAHHVNQNSGAAEADGSLHMFTYVQSAADAHEGFVDDAVSVGTGSTSNALGGTLNCGWIGRRCNGAAGGGWFLGNISRIVILSVDYSAAEVSAAFAIGP